MIFCNIRCYIQDESGTVTTYIVRFALCFNGKLLDRENEPTETGNSVTADWVRNPASYENMPAD